jgi:PIN domain nuclease of toxin-antitoxin system
MIVIDTHILIWAITDEHHKFSPHVINFIDKASRKRELYVSEFTYLEVAMLLAKGRLEFIGSLEDYLEEIEYCQQRCFRQKY